MHQQSLKHQEMKRESIPTTHCPNWEGSQEWQSYGRGRTTQLAAEGRGGQRGTYAALGTPPLLSGSWKSGRSLEEMPSSLCSVQHYPYLMEDSLVALKLFNF